MKRYFASGTLLTLGAMLFMSANAFAASITYVGTEELSGQGLGAKATVMTFQTKNGTSTTEWATVEASLKNGVEKDLIDGSKTTGQNQTWTRSALNSQVGTLTKDNFGIVFDLIENNGDPSLTVQEFRVRFYTDETDFSKYFDIFYIPGKASFEQEGGGTGGSGHLFKASFDSLTQFNSWTRIGMLIPEDKYISSAEDGHEDFAIVKLPSVPAVPVPAAVQIGGALLACVVTRQTLRRRAA